MTYFGEVGRAPVVAKNAMAATSHVKSSEVAVEILKAGGNAMDAAVAACAVQCVVEPGSTGIGGDCFALFSKNGGTDYVAYNGSGRAPAAATQEWYHERGIEQIDTNSPHAVTIPGAIDAWDRLIRDHGRMTLGELLQPAIKLAREGYKITRRVAFDFKNAEKKLGRYDHTASVFLPGGRVPEEGDIHHQLKLADSMDAIARDGRDVFYRGDIAKDIVDYLKGLGGLQTMDDFARAQGNYVKPIITTYKGYDVYQCPPNGQGIIALMLLKLMERIDTGNGAPLDIDRIHYEIEAGRLCYNQRDAYLADPEQSDVPVQGMLSDENIDRLFDLIKSDRAMEILPDPGIPDHKDTVYITVVDKDRNCCSFINTLFTFFGTGLMAPKSGIMLQSRGAGFTLEKCHPNVIAPHKRPLHTIIPAMVARNGKTVMSYGVMGGQYQAFGHMQFLSRLLNYGMNIQQAIDHPRFFPDINSGVVQVEDEIDSVLIEKLKKFGHKPVPQHTPIGGAQAISIDWGKGTLTGGSDPRKDGCAIGY